MYKNKFLIMIDLDATLECLDSVLCHFHASEELSTLIHKDPSEGNINEYLSALNRLKSAKEYFLSNKPQSVELDKVTKLFDTGCIAINNHYKMLLKKYGSTMTPIELMDLIEDDLLDTNCLPVNTIEELKEISDWLNDNLEHEYVKIFGDERSSIVLKSMNMLKDYQKDNANEEVSIIF